MNAQRTHAHMKNSTNTIKESAYQSPTPRTYQHELPGCDICSSDGKICYSCLGANTQLVVANITSYWKHGVDKCSLTCSDNYNAFGFLKFVYAEEGRKPVNISFSKLCLKSNIYIYIYCRLSLC